MADTALCTPKTRYGASEIFPGNRARRLLPLAAEAHRVAGLDSPDLAPDWSVGRFIQQDPIVGNRVYESYTYASNRPVSSTDALGLQTEEELADASKRAFFKAEDYTQDMLTAKKFENRGRAFEFEFHKIAQDSGWLGKDQPLYADVRLGKTRDGKLIVTKIGAGDGSVTPRYVQGREMLQETAAQYDIVKMRPGQKLEVGMEWVPNDTPNKVDSWLDNYAGKTQEAIDAKKGTSSMGRKASFMGGKTGKLLTYLGLSSFALGLIQNTAFGVAELPKAPGFKDFSEGIRTKRPRQVRLGGAEVHAHLLAQGKGWEANANAWERFYKYAENAVHQQLAMDKDK